MGGSLSEIEPSLEAVEPTLSDDPPSDGRTGLPLAIAAGLLFGAFELVVLGFSLRVPLSLPQWLGLGASILGADALFAGAVGAAAGAVSRRIEIQVGFPVLLLVGIYVLPGIGRASAEGQPTSLGVLLLMPAILAIAAGLQARVLRRSRVPMLYGAAIVGAIAVGVGFAANQGTETGGSGAALSGKPSIVVVTVDGWGADLPAPALDALAAGGVRFTEAVTPTPGSRAANATVLAGLHPLRHQVLDDDDVLSRGYQTLFEALADLGYPTAAFVSSSAVESGSGLDQGFARYDDQWSLLGRGALGSLLLRFADPVGPWRARRGTETAEAFAAWAQGRPGPWAAWVHLADPHRAELGVPIDADDELEAAAATIGAAIPEGALVVVAGTHGELRGRHGGTGNRTLYDAVVHVPLVVRFPGPAPVVPEVGVQVRLMDVASSVLDGAGFESLAESEGVPLIAYGTGFRKATISCGLVGRDLDGDWLLGVRNSGFKLVTGVGEHREELYVLSDDPGEERDRHDDEPAVLGQIRSLVSSDRAALVELIR